MFETARIPAVTGEEMAEVDRIMNREIGVDVLQLMEVAGRAVALFARDRMLDGDAVNKRVVILCGTGGNGGDGLVAARYLHAWGARVDVWLSHQPDPDRGIAAHQLAAVRNLNIPVTQTSLDPKLPPADLIVDALLGFSLASAPSGETAALIRAANAHSAPVLAVDLPSGLLATDGIPLDPCIRAAITLTLALPKRGLLEMQARAYVGALYLTDIGIPPEVYLRLGINLGPIFGAGETIEVY
jgi:NAD(P)H-hydrate epimerase